MSLLTMRRRVLPVTPPVLSLPMRWAIGGLGLLLLLAIADGVSRYATDPDRFPVMNVDVLGTLDYTDRDTLRSRVQTFTEQGFYALDIDAVRAGVETLPWVASAHVRRIWPGRLSIEIEEHEPAARWNDDALISKGLEMFQPPQLQADNLRYAEWQAHFSSLPKLSGAIGRHESVLDDFRRYQQALSHLDLAIESLAEDERRSQTLAFENGVTVRLGYADHELRLQRFIDVYPRVADTARLQPVRFDMRYSNGFALSGAVLSSDFAQLQDE